MGIVKVKNQQPSNGVVTVRDFVTYQSNVNEAFSQLQASGFNIVANEPKSASWPGNRGDIWFGTNGTFKLCLSPGNWALFQGVSF